MAGVADLDQGHRAIRMEGQAVPGAVQRRVGVGCGAVTGGRILQRRGQGVQRSGGLGQGRLVRQEEGQRQDRRDLGQAWFEPGVIGRAEDQRRPHQLQQFEIRGPAQAQIGDRVGDHGLADIGAISDQLGRGDGHATQGDGGFHHGPVNGRQAGLGGVGAQGQSRRQQDAGGGQEGAAVGPGRYGPGPYHV